MRTPEQVGVAEAEMGTNAREGVAWIAPFGVLKLLRARSTERHGLLITF